MMPASSKAEQRLHRLVGFDDESGGGLYLPTLFSTVCASLMDSEGMTADTLAPKVEQAIWKPSRVKQLYPESGYRGLTLDALEQLKSRKLAGEQDGMWRLTERFKPGKALTVIPRRNGREAQHITVHTKEERDRLNQEASQDRELKSMYADLRNERAFDVQVVGARKPRSFRLHPLARAIPQMTEEEFLHLAKDIKQNGVKMPLSVLDGQVLDGRHRLAVASALHIPVRVEEFKGDENAARDHVVSLNLMRRHLTTAQRALIVMDLLLPVAEQEAAAREEGGTLAPDGARVGKATQIAATRSNGLANARTLERMLPVRNAPRTQELVRSGAIQGASAARRAALEETGQKAPAEVPKSGSRSVNHCLAIILHHYQEAMEEAQNQNVGHIAVADLLAKMDKAEQAHRELRAFLEDMGEPSPDEVPA